jgi:DNA-binding MurR/RpiR family transcriptional regulator
MSSDKPTTLDALRMLIISGSVRLTPRMHDAARYALDHPSELALNPVASVAANASMSPAAFIRLAKALGFDGYAELQRLFREPLQRALKPTFRERIRHVGGEQVLDNPDDPAALLRALSQANIVSLEHLQADAATLPLREAVSLIQNARIVHVLGLRRSYAVAAYFSYALNRIGQPAVLITGQGGAIMEQASVVDAQDLLIAISFPPYAADTLTICDLVRQNGAKRLAITNAGLSPVAKDADLVLEVNDAELKGFRSLTSAMCLVQSLVMGLAFSKRQELTKKRKKKSGAAIVSALDLKNIDC